MNFKPSKDSLKKMGLYAVTIISFLLSGIFVILFIKDQPKPIDDAIIWLIYILGSPLLYGVGSFFIKKLKDSSTDESDGVEFYLGVIFSFIAMIFYAFWGYNLTKGMVTPTEFIFYLALMSMLVTLGYKWASLHYINIFNIISFAYAVLSIMFISMLVMGQFFEVGVEKTSYEYGMNAIYLIIGILYYFQYNKAFKDEDNLFEYFLE